MSLNIEQARRMAEEAAQVPLAAQLASVPETARLVIGDADGKGTRYIPVGRLCKEAAAVLAKLTQGQKKLPEFPPLPAVHVIKSRPTAPDGDMYCLGYETHDMLEYARRYANKVREQYTHPIPSQQEARRPLSLLQERVRELESVITVTRSAIKAAINKGNSCGWPEWEGLLSACSEIDAARSKEQPK